MNIKNVKILLSVCLLAALILVLPVMNACKEEGAIKVGISQVVTHPALDATRQGVIDGLADQGYVEGENTVIDYQNSEGDPSLFDTIAEKLVGDKVDVIVTIATPNTLSAIAAAKNTDIPVVFTAVTDPAGSGMVESWESHPDDNVTGVSDMIAVADDVDLITQIVPDIKTLGTLFNDGEANSVFLVEKLNEACDALGISVVEKPVSTSADVLTAAQSLVGQVDVIWIGTDNTVVSGLEALIGVCEEEGIPFFPSDHESVERGGIACYGFDYYDIGYQTGEMVAKILEGANAADIPVEKGKIVSLSVNTAAAERMGVTIPQEIIDSAAIVYDK
jgi:putative ABC transport system substrate-binding protein